MGEAGSDMIQQMLRTGAEVQGNNIRAMQELFETFWPTTGAPSQRIRGPPDRPGRARRPSARPDPGAPRRRRGRSPGGTG